MASVGNISMRDWVVSRAASGKLDARKREMVLVVICLQVVRIWMARKSGKC